MTRPVSRRHGAVWGGNLIAAHLHDSRLDVDVSVNGQPPRRKTGDRQWNLVRLRCPGCTQVGMVRGSEPQAGRSAPFYFTEAQIITSWEVAPPSSVTVLNELTPGSGAIQADCPAHGAVEFDPGAALRAARRAIEPEQLRVQVLDGRRTGQRRPLRCDKPGCCTYSDAQVDELFRQIGRDTPR